MSRRAHYRALSRACSGSKSVTEKKNDQLKLPYGISELWWDVIFICYLERFVHFSEM